MHGPEPVEDVPDRGQPLGLHHEDVSGVLMPLADEARVPEHSQMV